MTWLLTGGAGYIGAHVARALLDAGMDVVVYDDLSTGLARKVPDGVPLVEASVVDRDALVATFRDHRVEGVIHLAAKKAAGESMEIPLHYYRENLVGMLVVLEAMVEAEVRHIVLSSSAAVYGTPGTDLVTEDSPTVPESPYGETKLASEWMVRRAAAAHGLTYSLLRYFNVAGAGSPELGDTGAFNLIPMVFRALANEQRPQVFGDDYDTPDGSCVRDYIHVADLAEAHVMAAARLGDGGSGVQPGSGEVFNVGTGEGASVFEVIDTIRRVTGETFEIEVVGRRPGDPARIVASPERIVADLGWRARHDLEAMVSSAWEARSFLG